MLLIKQFMTHHRKLRIDTRINTELKVIIGSCRWSIARHEFVRDTCTAVCCQNGRGCYLFREQPITWGDCHEVPINDQSGHQNLWEETYELSLLFALSTNVRRTVFPSSPASSIPSPKHTTSMATLFFFNFFASLTMDFSSAPCPSNGEPTNTMIRWRRFLLSLCFKASCAIAIAVGILISPPILDKATWRPCRIWPISLVCVTRTSGLHFYQSRSPSSLYI